MTMVVEEEVSVQRESLAQYGFYNPLSQEKPRD